MIAKTPAFVAVLICGLAVTTLWPRAVEAQGEAWPIWTGAFSPEQAARGKAGYELFCASCHGGDLAGQNGPALKGERFLSIWDAATLREFYRKVSTTMPRAQARLDDAVYVDVIAYVLQQNGFPTGPRELTVQADVLGRFQIVGANGPLAAENGQLVSAVGCLARDASGWMLTRASTPVRSRSLEQTADRGLEGAGGRAGRLVDATADGDCSWNGEARGAADGSQGPAQQRRHRGDVAADGGVHL